MTDEVRDALERVKLERQKEREAIARETLSCYMDGELAELILEELIDKGAI